MHGCSTAIQTLATARIPLFKRKTAQDLVWTCLQNSGCWNWDALETCTHTHIAIGCESVWEEMYTTLCCTSLWFLSHGSEQGKGRRYREGGDEGHVKARIRGEDASVHFCFRGRLHQLNMPLTNGWSSRELHSWNKCKTELTYYQDFTHSRLLRWRKRRGMGRWDWIRKKGEKQREKIKKERMKKKNITYILPHT